jgi:LysR family transcriptional regulator, transcriptional activator for bauABCD operon
MPPNPRRMTHRLSDSDLRLLRIFCTVTRCGGFAAAESELQLGLPSISRYIKSLEIRLGMRLCHRGRVGFSLTEQGRQVYTSSLRLIADIERFEGDMRSLHTELTGTLNVGIIDNLITDRNLQVPDLLRTYKASHPRVQFAIRTATSNIVEQSVLDGSLHLGIIHERRPINTLDYRFLFRERCSLYCAAGHPLFRKMPPGLRPEDLARYDYAGFAYLGDGGHSVPDGLLVRTASVDSMEALATLISTGCYIGFLPDHYVESVWRLRQFRSILPDLLAYHVDIKLVSRQGECSPLVRALLAHLEEASRPAQSTPRTGVVKRLADARQEGA